MKRKTSAIMMAVIVAGSIAGIFANGQVASASQGLNANNIGFDKDNFSNPLNIDNKYFPLKPGTSFIMRGSADGVPTKNVFVVTDKTKEINGVVTRVIHDTAYEEGKIIEFTKDWYAQDDDGNVWYFGEFTTNIVTGSHEGSFQAGVNGAKAGIIMEAKPKVGDTYNEEQAKNVAEDKATVISTTASICVPYRCFDHVLVTKNFTPLEPNLEERKYYAPGIGEIKELITKGGSEVSRLVDIKN